MGNIRKGLVQALREVPGHKEGNTLFMTLHYPLLLSPDPSLSSFPLALIAVVFPLALHSVFFGYLSKYFYYETPSSFTTRAIYTKVLHYPNVRKCHYTTHQNLGLIQSRNLNLPLNHIHLIL
jgi:hypothetical protein